MIQNKSNGTFRYEYEESEGLVSIFVHDNLIVELSDENGDPESVFTWFITAYTKTNLALSYTGYVEWNKPNTTPIVEKGTEREFWLAVEVTPRNTQPSAKEATVITFLAQYQNRPYAEGDEDFDEEPLVSVGGDYVSSVGWVTCKAHEEFDNYYELIHFTDNYKLLGWAEYAAPKFNCG